MDAIPQAIPQDPEHAEFRSVASSAGLDDANALRLLRLHYAAVAARDAEFEAAMVTAAREEIIGWAVATRADKEIGGANLNESVALAQSVLNEFVPGKALSHVLENLGYGNHPEIIRLLSRAARALRAARQRAVDTGG